MFISIYCANVHTVHLWFIHESNNTVIKVKYMRLIIINLTNPIVIRHTSKYDRNSDDDI
jgi:hypothetical protein